jgi:hypothetical protein
VGDLSDGRHVRSEPVDERDLRQRHDAGSLIDSLLIAFGGDGIVDAVQKLDLRSPRALRQPDVRHGGKFVLAHHHVVASIARIEPQRIRDRIDARGRAGDDRNLVWPGVDEARKSAAQRLVGFHPFIPGRRRGPPTGRVFLHAGLHGVA